MEIGIIIGLILIVIWLCLVEFRFKIQAKMNELVIEFIEKGDK